MTGRGHDPCTGNLIEATAAGSPTSEEALIEEHLPAASTFAQLQEVVALAGESGPWRVEIAPGGEPAFLIMAAAGLRVRQYSRPTKARFIARSRLRMI
jgi:hypothetical protein